MALLAVTAIGADQPGIIARVTGVLLDNGGNLSDSSMTILAGHFAIVLLVDCDADPATLESDLAQATADLGLVISVRPAGPGHESAPATHIVSVYGADRPGIVHAVAEALAQQRINITDLTTKVLHGQHPVYAMLLEVCLSEGTDASAVAAAIRERVGLEVSVEPLDMATF